MIELFLPPTGQDGCCLDECVDKAISNVQVQALGSDARHLHYVVKMFIHIGQQTNCLNITMRKIIQ